MVFCFDRAKSKSSPQLDEDEDGQRGQCSWLTGLVSVSWRPASADGFRGFQRQNPSWSVHSSLRLISILPHFDSQMSLKRELWKYLILQLNCESFDWLRNVTSCRTVNSQICAAFYLTALQKQTEISQKCSPHGQIFFEISKKNSTNGVKKKV